MSDQQEQTTVDPPKQPEKRKRVEWDPEFIPLARVMAEEGAIDSEIAAAIGTSLRNFDKWKAKHKALRDALKLGKEGPNEQVKRSLYMRARGFYYRAFKVLNVQGRAVAVPYLEYEKPETLACIFFLKNRMPAEFKDIKAVEHSRLIRKEDAAELPDAEIRRRLVEVEREREILLARVGTQGTRAN